jgi:5-methylcytosine-specific restriction protein B
MATWGIHNDIPAIDPRADNAVRIGWDEMGDLSTIAPTRDAFKASLAEKMPGISDEKIPSNAGTLYRFVHTVQIGDMIVCPERANNTLDIGRVSGSYEFHPET